MQVIANTSTVISYQSNATQQAKQQPAFAENDSVDISTQAVEQAANSTLETPPTDKTVSSPTPYP
jgi:hypothetical protein